MATSTSKRMYFIGLDPGVSGGIAVLSQHGRPMATLKLAGATERDILGFLSMFPDSHAMLEKVWSQPGCGHSGAFKFGGSYYGLRMALTAVGIPFDEVIPVKWQTTLSCRTKGDKNVTRRRAEDLFPMTKITHAIADALLIAVYARRLFKGTYGKKEGDVEARGGSQEGARQEGRRQEIRGGGPGGGKTSKARAAVVAGDGAAQGQRPGRCLPADQGRA